MSKFLDIIRERRAAIAEERTALLAEADMIAENRDEFDAARGDEIIARLNELNDEDRAAERRESDLAAAAERAEAATKSPVFMRRLDDPTDVTDARQLGDADVRGRALTMVEQSRSFIADSHRENVTRLIENRGAVGAVAARLAITTGSATYERAWSKYMAGDEMSLSGEERQALGRGRDAFSAEERMTSGTGSSGGFFVPVFIDPSMIITGAGAVNPIRDIATVKQIGPAFGGWYGATAGQVSAAWTAEAGAAPNSDPTLTQPNIPVWMAEAFIPVTYQAFQDISDLAADLVALFADAKNNLEAAAFVTGSGSSQPTGVVTAVAAVTASRVSPTTGGTLGYQDSFLLHSAIPARFQTGGNNWAGSIAAVDRIRSTAAAANSANSLWTDLSAGNPALLLGEPVRVASAMSTSFTTGQDVLLYGDFSRYYVIDRIGLTTEFIPNLFDTTTGRPTANRGWIAYWRTGANAVDTNAFRLLRL